jgi:EAL and modified HD-GYP domain-containing signal transduction protein
MDVFVARQPIFDARHRVLGYELLYRRDVVAQAAENGAGNGTYSLMVDALLGLGLSQLTGGRTAYINVSKEMLVEGVADLLNPTEVVLELVEEIEPDDQVLEVCRDLVERGFRLALDHFVFDPTYAPLLELADVVKVDVLSTGEGRLDFEVASLKPYRVKLLAEKVESAEVHAKCVELGFEMFQGFHYFRPEQLTKKDLSTQSVTVVRLLNLLKDMNATDTVIEEAFRSDPGLSYKLLRMVNSAAMGGRGVESIRHALRLLGRDPLYRWLSLLLLSGRDRRGELRAEIVRSALLRGRMCELASDAMRGPGNRGIPSPDAMFLVGLFSHMDALLHMPMEDVLEQISLSDDVRAAILDKAGPGGALLSAVMAYEEAEWELAEKYLAAIGADASSISDVYLDAVTWAGSRMAMHEE